MMQSQPKGANMALGYEDFREIRERNIYYVDKTKMIGQFLEAQNKVTLVTRPRRFGKTLNMSMLAEFFDITKDSRDVFAGTQIMDTDWVEEMNRYPVISLSFGNVRGDDALFLLRQLAYEIMREYQRYAFLWEESRLPQQMRDDLKKTYRDMCGRHSSKEFGYLSDSLTELCTALEMYYSRKVYVFIDEYDTPFIDAMIEGFYDEVRKVLSVMLSSVLKGNPSLQGAYLTGIQRVAKENIFSGLNNIAVCTACSSEYADCFGFTEQETAQLLESCGMSLDDNVRSMYDGYCFGDRHIYNPWSVIYYAKRKELEAFWVNTSENSLIRRAMADLKDEFAPGYEELIEKGTYETMVRTDCSFYEEQSVESLWGLLLNSGMVTAEKAAADGLCTLRIPNQEVKRAFRDLTASYLGVKEGSMFRLFYYLMKKDMERFAENYRKLLSALPSYHDLKEENSYHMMMLGMCTFITQDYDVRSNRESGRGRSDILLKAKVKDRPDIVMEFKYTKDKEKDLNDLARQALEQIREKDYAAELDGKALCIGLAHRGKNAVIAYEEKG